MTAPDASMLTVTDAKGIAHLVTDAAMTAGRPHGRYVAACGREVLAASLTTQQSSACRPCRTALQ